ncbi:hypothetical protein H103_04473 [Trichophyton rubrum CBS 288.86]|uniref:histone acetyltransferase n=1 Tax=Trichophyton rubrum CBS 288.86 TaxID=1215330 RepID=A0A022W280_TRIRU|nr:hypothetical protein H100_04478 [Trichophyton rubrum MR850]EZF52404.1 hypothetical protein H103_04473 [Trichophyton rubrum CBS 288.86]EZF84403.1 hypothetical protein H110_04464 [Trichophyton rubrum MR1448]
MSPVTLEEALSQAVRKDVNLVVRHVAGAPTPCPPIFSAPIGEPDEPTICKQHFLAVSINPGAEKETKQDTDNEDSADSDELLVFAIEVLVYTTDKLSTLFVSKADSTGYLSLLNRDQNSPAAYSLTRNVLSTFLYHLVRIYQKPDVTLVLSLFARAQDQYLFPGSSEHKGKHILDDRGLIKWWCRVIDPIMKSLEQGNNDRSPINSLDTAATVLTKQSVATHLIVPGCDTFETKNFIPKSGGPVNTPGSHWRLDYPLHQICSYPNSPPRCLVPRFPDDPKARFLIDLDDEITDENPPHELKNSGKWHSVKTLDQFWEMMSYRQECSAGRLVGFLWMVVKPSTNSVKVSDPTQCEGSSANENQAVKSDPVAKRESHTENLSVNHEHAIDDSIIEISNSDYKALADFLLDLDFSNQSDATANTKLWIEELSSLSGCNKKGLRITGTAAPVGPPPPTVTSVPPVSTNVLGNGLIRKRKRQPSATAAVPGDNTVVHAHGPSSSQTAGDGLKVHTDLQATTVTQEQTSNEPSVNVLGGNLIRKKKKTEE